MDFANEFYVRIYLRDTTTWKRLGWDGQNVLMQILRKMDLAGVLDLEELEPWEAAVLHCGAPEEVSRVGMERCLRLGCFVHSGHYLVAPRYRDANETRKSDRLRTLESRTRRRLVALSGDTDALQTGSSQNVAERDSSSRIVTGHSGIVTDGHDSQQKDTPGHTPSHSVTRTVAKRSGSDSDSVALRSVPGGERAGARGAPPTGLRPFPDSDPERPPAGSLAEQLAEAWARLALTTVTPAVVAALLELEPDVERAAARSGEPATACFERSARAFVADCAERGKRPVLRWLCTQWAEWSAEPSAPPETADDRRREAAQRNADEQAEQMRAEHERYLAGVRGTAPQPEFAEPAAATPELAEPTPAPIDLPHAQKALREAQAALRAARDAGASETEITQRLVRVRELSREALNEQRAAEGQTPLGEGAAT